MKKCEQCKQSIANAPQFWEPPGQSGTVHGVICNVCCPHRSRHEFHDGKREYLNDVCADGCGTRLPKNVPVWIEEVITHPDPSPFQAKAEETNCDKHKTKGLCSAKGCKNQRASCGSCPACKAHRYKKYCRRSSCPRRSVLDESKS